MNKIEIKISKSNQFYFVTDSFGTAENMSWNQFQEIFKIYIDGHKEVVLTKEGVNE